MNIHTMHREVQIEVQQLNAARSRKLHDSEFDLAINDAIEKFARQCVKPDAHGRPRFEIEQTRADDIQSLIMREKFTAYLDGKNYFTSVADDHWMLLSDSSEVRKLCTDATTTKTFDTFQVIEIPIKPSAGMDSRYYKRVEVTISGITVVDITSSLAGKGHIYNGMDSAREYTEISHYIAQALRGQGYKVYNERWNDIYKQGSLLVVIPTPNAPSAILNIDNVISILPVHTRTFPVVNVSNYTMSNVPNALTKSNMLDDVLSTPYYGTGPDQPVSELYANRLTVYGDTGWIVRGITLSYIRKPAHVSLILNTDCDLPESTHKRICSMAADTVKIWIEGSPEKSIELKQITS